LSCDEGQVVCGDKCVDPKTDKGYCGANESCQNYVACQGEQVCIDGQCAECLDENCEVFCIGDACNPEDKCGPGQIICDGDCVDPLTDSNWCGAYDACVGGKACREGEEVCVGGECVSIDMICTVEGQVRCDGVCIDPLNDPAYCGATAGCLDYSNCSDEQVCTNGRCVSYSVECPVTEDGSPRVLCHDDCIDPQNDKLYCGANAACSVYTTCDLDNSICFEGECIIKCPEVNHVYLPEYGLCVWRCTQEGGCGSGGGGGCSKGYHAVSGLGCVYCPEPWEWKDGKCIHCFANQYYDAEQTKCVNCPAGQIFDEEANSCIDLSCDDVVCKDSSGYFFTGECREDPNAGVSVCYATECIPPLVAVDGKCRNRCCKGDDCKVCATDQYCEDGDCVCRQGTELCGELCVDLNEDAENCGGCGVKCADIENAEDTACLNSACIVNACKVGYHIVNNECVADTAEECSPWMVDCTLQPGVALTKCASDGVCENEDCCQAESCAEGYHLDGRKCVQDTTECCGAECAQCDMGQVCSNGECKDSCDEPLSFCDGECVNWNSDTDNCGACGHVCATEDVENSVEMVCRDQECVASKCAEGYHLFNGICEADTEENCGEH
ncbi:MAG: hypothetical protein IJ268_02975, partial [Proteobacteria bacterium]|nr:hypothetical protein [Pseudomonadota bacterium]